MRYRSNDGFVLALLGSVFCAWELRAGELSFNGEIRPLLSDRCFACHGFDGKAREADLRLDVPEVAYAEREGGPAILPGDPEASQVWQRINSDDPEKVMPPSGHLLSLSADQKDLIRRWIKEGGRSPRALDLRPG